MNMGSNMVFRVFLHLALSSICIAIDQASKFLARTYLTPGKTLWVVPFLDLKLETNFGCAFSLLENLGKSNQLILCLLSLLIILTVIVYVFDTIATGKDAFFETILIAGGLSNLLDRFMLGYVVDFISLHASGYFWPTFNFADCWIVLGSMFIAARIIK
jgi:signal peptidase II